MIVDVTVNRKFLSGLLEGLETKQTWYEDSKLAPSVGDVLDKKNVRGSSYQDTVVSVEPR